jgi:hypothetical protein
MKFLEASKPFITEANELDSEIRIKKNLQMEAGQGLSELKEISDSLKKEIDKINK